MAFYHSIIIFSVLLRNDVTDGHLKVSILSNISTR